MTKYIVFLRGINVGGRIIKMTELKACLENAGLPNVVTVLQTGNVAFDSDKSQAQLKGRIETSLNKQFNYPARIQVLTAEQLASIIKNYPFKPKDGFHSYVIFIENGLEKELVAEASDIDKGKERVQAGHGVVYWQVERGQTLKSNFSKLLSKAKYKDFNTNRNLNTLKKIIN